MKKSMLTITASFLLLSTSILGACSNNETANKIEPTASNTATMPVNEVTASPEPSVAPDTGAEESASPDGNDPQASDRPLTRTFDALEGGVPAEEGTLMQGDGYSLYVFDGYNLDAQTGRLSLTEDSSYYAEIEPLPSGYDLAALEQQGQTELSAIGKPNNYSGELFEHPLGYAELYLQTSGAQGIEDYMVWKNEAGEAYLFRIHNPKGETAEKFAWVMVSLSTIKGK